MNFIDLSYFHNRTAKPETLLETHRPNLGYFDHLPRDWNCTLVKFADAQGQAAKNSFDYYYFKGSSSKFWLPIAADRFVARLQPDVVMVHGLIFPQQVLLLRMLLPRHTRIIIQHHAERPRRGRMQTLQKRADEYVSAYLFATRELAKPWVEAGIIPETKVSEVMEGSSVMQRTDKQVARNYLGLSDAPVFLWVGRLDENKDPLTVVEGFAEYCLQKRDAKLYMVYPEDNEMLDTINLVREQNSELRDTIVLLGKLEKDQLAYWYSAADYYLSGSHSEGSGYALIEAMSCGCIPVVTDIPSFRKITKDGTIGFLFKPGDKQGLAETLFCLHQYPVETLVPEVLKQFENELSFKAIAGQIMEAVFTLPRLGKA